MDYKTDQLDPEALAARYGEQVRAYAGAWAALAGAPVAYAGLYSVRAGALGENLLGGRNREEAG